MSASASTSSVQVADSHHTTIENDERTELVRVRDHWKRVYDEFLSSLFVCFSHNVYPTIEIDFNSKRETLDKQGLEIAEQREKSSNARKKLSQETKVFKKLKEAEKTAKFAKLLKSYQEEIDNLTKRALYVVFFLSSLICTIKLYNNK
jgi:hypothetical protein